MEHAKAGFARWFGWLRPRRGPVFRWIPPEKIVENPRNVRRIERPEEFECLKQSIARLGIVVPVLVVREGRRFRLVAGHRRVRAARELGMRRIPAIVRALSRPEVDAVAVAENEHRVGLTDWELARVVERAAARRGGADPHRIAQAMGIPWEAVERGAALERLSKTIQEAVLAGEIGLEVAQVLDEVPDAELQAQLVEMVREESLDVEEARAMVDRVMRKQPAFVTTRESRHFHSVECPFAQLIPDDRRVGLYSRREGRRWGKIACMNCL